MNLERKIPFEDGVSGGHIEGELASVEEDPKPTIEDVLCGPLHAADDEPRLDPAQLPEVGACKWDVEPIFMWDSEVESTRRHLTRELHLKQIRDSLEGREDMWPKETERERRIAWTRDEKTHAGLEFLADKILARHKGSPRQHI